MASCTACRDACPVSALVIDDEVLGIDPGACNGCGLCQPACPQAAVSIDGDPPVSDGSALLVCEESPQAHPRLCIACVHSQGLEQLAGLHEKGVRQLIISTGNCNDCRNAAASRLDGHVANFNELAGSRKLPGLTISEPDDINAEHWLNEIRPDEAIDSRRRGFLFALTPPTTDPEISGFPRSRRALARFLGPQAGSEDTPLYAMVPIIDGTRCDGCNACVEICPESVLTLINEPAAGKCYKVLPENCTGCHLCIDVCDAEAVRLEPMSSSLDADIPLESHRCRACGVRYHMPDSHFPVDGLCRICLQTNHHKKLFQVLE